jgi:hypothetical protein
VGEETCGCEGRLTIGQNLASATGMGRAIYDAIFGEVTSKDEIERVWGIEMCISRLDSGDYTYIAVNEKAIEKPCVQSIARLNNLKTILPQIPVDKLSSKT